MSDNIKKAICIVLLVAGVSFLVVLSRNKTEIPKKETVVDSLDKNIKHSIDSVNNRIVEIKQEHEKDSVKIVIKYITKQQEIRELSADSSLNLLIVNLKKNYER